MNTWSRLFLTTLGLTVGGFELAQAELKDVHSGPYTAATGHFPQWYQDNDDLSLELCQSRAVSSRAGGYMCTLLPEPGLYDDTQPMVFPNNWPSELFWFLAEANIPATANGYELEVYTAAIEAAFAQEVPRLGDQQSFARIRIRANIPVAGTYTVTHPYGVETFTVTPAQAADRGGRRAINMTRDIGIGAPGVFTGALNGDVGPFLIRAGGPLQETNPDTGEVERFVGDPNVPEAVTGSPLATNYVEISGPAGTIRTDLFSLSGKIFDSRSATPVEIERASYRRTSQGTRLEVFANGPANAEFCYRETLELVEGGAKPACLQDMVNDGTGYFFAHNPAPAVLPPFVVVTATDPNGVTKPTSVSGDVTDVVKISSARYSWADHSLTIEASSSDEVQVPDLAAQGFGRLTKAGVLQSLRVTDLAQPPAVVTVKSAAGGADTEPVVVVGSAPEETPNQPPVAVADAASTSFGVPVSISVLANDSDADGDLPLTITDLTQPGAGLGSVALNGSTAVVYTPPPVVNSPLTATFTYRAMDVRGEASLPATVTVSVSPNQPPVGVADTGSTLGVPLTLDVLANDSDPEGNVPLSVANLTQPAAGQGSASTDGTSITYTPPATVTSAFTASFTYQVQDAFGALSAPVTVSVQVSPPPAGAENLTVTTAEFTLRSNNRVTWSLDGQSSITTGNSLRVQVTTTTGLLDLGNVTVPASGRWRLSVTTTNVTPSANPTATITSSHGTVRTVPIGPR
ncbi:Ig-like domain-containing protein [Pseudomonas sp. Q1-7]|uniref:Ig-like domain-containing protein n=1 Tax=Pseudomonas sp. Q1-7 TaxID=3020843 RepID=UPI00230047A1|nr:Ig-like domain-containing protein [Pseudomonas sp. Q1-7]